MDGKHLAQIGAIIFAAVAITTALIDARPRVRTDLRPPLDPIHVMVGPDPLARDIARCQLLGEAGAHDARCLAAWAENRRRFLTPGSAAQAGTAAADDPHTNPSQGH